VARVMMNIALSSRQVTPSNDVEVAVVCVAALLPDETRRPTLRYAVRRYTTVGQEPCGEVGVSQFRSIVSADQARAAPYSNAN
jgi:hypothetical protein